MDPASAVLGIASGAVGLVAITSQVITYLVGLRDSHRNARLVILDLVTTCQAFEVAWTTIHQWAVQSCDLRNSNFSDGVLEQLLSFIDVSKIILELIQSDLRRLGPSGSKNTRWGHWWMIGTRPNNKDVARLLLHEKVVLQHCDRLHRQISSLNLLISILTLSSSPVQDAVLEVLRPTFRKDEESAWTIVNTKQSARSRCLLTPCTSRRVSVESKFSRKSLRLVRFAFDDDLYQGPVYRRLLITKLCEQPASESQQPSQSSAVSDPIQDDGHQVRAPENDDNMISCLGIRSDALALELRESGVFSRSFHEDFCEFLACHRPRRLQRRHIPLASILRKNDLTVDQQTQVNTSFYTSIRQGNLKNIVATLDAGADINFRVDGRTALEYCVQRWYTEKGAQPDLPHPSTTVAEFLLLYKETHVPYNFGPNCCTILHLCMYIGASEDFMRPFLKPEDPTPALCELDARGITPIHTAVLSSDTGLFCLSELNQMFSNSPLETHKIVDRWGISAEKFAVSRSAVDHARSIRLLGKVDKPRVYGGPASSSTQLKIRGFDEDGEFESAEGEILGLFADFDVSFMDHSTDTEPVMGGDELDWPGADSSTNVSSEPFSPDDGTGEGDSELSIISRDGNTPSHPATHDVEDFATSSST